MTNLFPQSRGGSAGDVPQCEGPSTGGKQRSMKDEHQEMGESQKAVEEVCKWEIDYINITRGQYIEARSHRPQQEKPPMTLRMRVLVGWQMKPHEAV